MEWMLDGYCADVLPDGTDLLKDLARRAKIAERQTIGKRGSG